MAKGKKTRKCQFCNVDDTLMEEMEFDMIGVKKPVKKFYHKGKCWDAYLKDKEFRAKEQREKDELNETLLKIYGVKEIPKQAWTLLSALREGNPVFGSKQKTTKRYKEGYDYPLIRETFDYCSDTIEYYNSVKPFDGFMSAFKYALSIIIDKIYFVEQRRIQREQQKQLLDTYVANANSQEFESNYKKPKKSNTDISNFLDD